MHTAKSKENPRIVMLTFGCPRDGPVSSSSLHVHEHLPSMLWVVDSGSLATLCSSYMHTGSTLRVMVNRLARVGDSATH